MEGSKCTATGEGLSRARAGVPAVLQIKAADRFGNRRSTGMLTLRSPRLQATRHGVLTAALIRAGGDKFDVKVQRTGKGSTSAAVKGKVEVRTPLRLLLCLLLIDAA